VFIIGGESIILHKDKNGNHYLMIKMNRFVFLVDYGNGIKKYRLG
jgi:hypothetical protein